MCGAKALLEFSLTSLIKNGETVRKIAKEIQATFLNGNKIRF